MKPLTNNEWVTLKVIFSPKKLEIEEMINPLITTPIQWSKTLTTIRKSVK